MSFWPEDQETISESKKNVGSLIMNITPDLPLLNIHNDSPMKRKSFFLANMIAGL